MDQDKKLIQDFLVNRSERNFLNIYKKYSENLMRTAMYLARHDMAMADDLFQETWITALRKLGTFEGKSSLKTWLTGILINKYREWVKKMKSARPILNTVPQKVKGPSNDLAMDLKRAIIGLPDGYREILTLYDVQGFKHREIGELLGIEVGTSKSQLAQARKKLRTILHSYR